MAFPTGKDLEIALKTEMPFGKYKGTRLMDLPFAYLIWFEQQGWPPGRLGEQMATVYELQANDFDVLEALRKQLG